MLQQYKQWIKSAVIMFGFLMLTWSMLMSSANNEFIQIVTTDSARFVPGNTDGLETEEITFINARLFESMVWVINAGMGVVIAMAGFHELKPLAFASGGWLILFAVFQLAIISAYSSLGCSGDLSDGCGDSGLWVGYEAITSFIIIIYVFMGALTIYFGYILDGATCCPQMQGAMKSNAGNNQRAAAGNRQQANAAGAGNWNGAAAANNQQYAASRQPTNSRQYGGAGGNQYGGNAQYANTQHMGNRFQ